MFIGFVQIEAAKRKEETAAAAKAVEDKNSAEYRVAFHAAEAARKQAARVETDVSTTGSRQNVRTEAPKKAVGAATSAVAEEAGVSVRTVERAREAARAIGKGALSVLSGTSLDEAEEIKALVKLPEKKRTYERLSRYSLAIVLAASILPKAAAIFL